jgi:hypothetical protein
MEQGNLYAIAGALEELSLELQAPVDIIDLVTQSGDAGHVSALLLASERIEQVYNQLDMIAAQLSDMHRAKLKLPKSKRS